MASQDSNLFKPLKIGNVETKHRIIMTSLTRYRAEDDHTHNTKLATAYYSQRASIPGTLIMTEGTIISARGSGLGNSPGMWTAAQIQAWKEIVSGVHKRGSFIFSQLFACGPMAAPELAEKEGFEIVGPSAIPVTDGAHMTPREMTEIEILSSIDDFAQAAKNAIFAGFDGVELHASYGTLIDQFVQDVSNHRADGWGGSVERRSRYAIEVFKAVGKEIGIGRVGIRFSPWGTYLSMGMEDPTEQYTYLIAELAKLGIQHLHLVEPRVDGIFDVESSKSNAALVDTWMKHTDAPIILSGGYTPADAAKMVDETYAGKNVLVGFGRPFTSNPDLVYRIKHGIGFTPYSRDTFYAVKSKVGYADWPFSQEFLAATE